MVSAMEKLLSIGNGVLVLSFLKKENKETDINKFIYMLFKNFHFIFHDYKNRFIAYLYESLSQIKQIYPCKEIKCLEFENKINELTNQDLRILQFLKEEIIKLFLMRPNISLDKPLLKRQRNYTGININMMSIEDLKNIDHEFLENKFTFELNEIRRYRLKNTRYYISWNSFWNDIKTKIDS